MRVGRRKDGLELREEKVESKLGMEGGRGGLDRS